MFELSESQKRIILNKISMQQIPSVDLRDFLSDDPARKQKFVNEIGKAYEDIGFVALKGHFLDDKLVEDLY